VRSVIGGGRLSLRLISDGRTNIADFSAGFILGGGILLLGESGDWRLSVDEPFSENLPAGCSFRKMRVHAEGSDPDGMEDLSGSHVSLAGSKANLWSVRGQRRV
jgi:hypothetical protein